MVRRNAPCSASIQVWQNRLGHTWGAAAHDITVHDMLTWSDLELMLVCSMHGSMTLGICECCCAIAVHRMQRLLCWVTRSEAAVHASASVTLYTAGAHPLSVT